MSDLINSDNILLAEKLVYIAGSLMFLLLSEISGEFGGDGLRGPGQEKSETLRLSLQCILSHQVLTPPTIKAQSQRYQDQVPVSSQLVWNTEECSGWSGGTVDNLVIPSRFRGEDEGYNTAASLDLQRLYSFLLQSGHHQPFPSLPQ